MFSSLLILSAIAAAVNAHFQMQFPPPRGVFVEDNEPNFCDGYPNAVSNRSEFPLGNAFITFNSEHPSWTATVLISIDQNPTTFAEFNKSSTGVNLPPAVPFFKASGEGAVCVPIDIGALNITGVKDGSNVTIQVEFNGGDGQLFQCADLTLSSTFTIPSSIQCTNEVDNATSTTASGTATSASGTGTAPAASGTGTGASGSSSAVGLQVGGLVAALLGTIGAFTVLML
ncbi:hypothetical protein BD410DRAFT_738021 [Rickenella mellea]|uniref:Copper acquisition factor BIM1-like domain-containing protein n=1 Tax=Rickenella mellea TaxID=50990 RepID=A0A4Y7QNX2_9AGAM|nr:hypothetical protein BD410DRAFT_738021 [Rickenella mellea]